MISKAENSVSDSYGTDGVQSGAADGARRKDGTASDLSAVSAPIGQQTHSGLPVRHSIADDLARLDIDELNSKYSNATPMEILDLAIKKLYAGQIALVSSFGAESAILLHMAAQIDPYIPVIFIDTGKLFDETLEYRDQLIEQFGLKNIQTFGPSARDLEATDPTGELWKSDVDGCCHIRKVIPFEKALAPFMAQISGRKRFQNEVRAKLGFFEQAEEMIKVNPLINWSPAELASYVVEHDLPRHSLVAKGYPSIGCAPCTSPVKEGEDPRAGRWRGEEKTECGIHFVDGKPQPMRG